MGCGASTSDLNFTQDLNEITWKEDRKTKKGWRLFNKLKEITVIIGKGDDKRQVSSKYDKEGVSPDDDETLRRVLSNDFTRAMANQVKNIDMKWEPSTAAAWLEAMKLFHNCECVWKSADAASGYVQFGLALSEAYKYYALDFCNPTDGEVYNQADDHFEVELEDAKEPPTLIFRKMHGGLVGGYLAHLRALVESHRTEGVMQFYGTQEMCNVLIQQAGCFSPAAKSPSSLQRWAQCVSAFVLQPDGGQVGMDGNAKYLPQKNADCAQNFVGLLPAITEALGHANEHYARSCPEVISMLEVLREVLSS